MGVASPGSRRLAAARGQAPRLAVLRGPTTWWRAERLPDQPLHDAKDQYADDDCDGDCQYYWSIEHGRGSGAME